MSFWKKLIGIKDTAASPQLASPATSMPEPFIDNGNGTVTDIKTGLIWQKTDDGKKRHWDEAMKYAESISLAGHSRWRLPSKDELVAFRGNATGNTNIRDAYFPGLKSAEHWSSTPYENNVGDSYYVSFNPSEMHSIHSVSYAYKDRYDFYVRCVSVEVTQDAPAPQAAKPAAKPTEKELSKAPIEASPTTTASQTETQPPAQQTAPKLTCDSCGTLEESLVPITLDTPKGRNDIRVCSECFGKAFIGGLQSGNLHFEKR